MTREYVIGEKPLSLVQVGDFVFSRDRVSSIKVSPDCLERVRKSHHRLYEFMERQVPIYGVTTGFGDSCFRVIPKEKSEQLQSNLISYLLCGTGKALPKEASRAMMLFRLQSLSRGFSGISPELVQRIALYLEKDWIPVVPREGSLGASGDLIPLAYLAQALQGEGELHGDEDQKLSTREVLSRAGVEPYVLKAKEGLALVNGTSAMAGLCLVNLNSARFLTELGSLMSSWLCLGLQGRTEPFEPFVNERAKQHSGQTESAQHILEFLKAESYFSKPLDQVQIQGSQIQEFIQDRYSLRCAPQILGPVLETLSLAEGWLQLEGSGVSDNPLVDAEGNLAMGGNFYGGYLSHGMDYLKISLAQLADLFDRQLTSLIDEKSNRGLPANLAAWNSMPESERFLHHGLKGLHQAVNALTSEILPKAVPNSIFSRSSESHNQDKVSLGMSAAVQCMEMIEPLFTLSAMYLICLAQAIDLRKIQLKGSVSSQYYEMIRGTVPFVERDQSLEKSVRVLARKLKTLAAKRRESGAIL